MLDLTMLPTLSHTTNFKRSERVCKANKPRCELEMPGNDRYIPEIFKQRQTAKSTLGSQ